MSHETHDARRKVYRLNTLFWIVDDWGEHVRLETEVEITHYGLGEMLIAVNAEGLFFVFPERYQAWGMNLYRIVKHRIELEYKLDSKNTIPYDEKFDQATGRLVIPVAKLSTG